MPIALYTFTDQQLVDIRRYCGYPAYGDGDVVFPQPWIMRQYLALEYRLQHMTQDEGTTLVNVHLANCATAEQAIMGASANLDTDQASVWKHNKNEVRDRVRLYTWARRQLLNFIGVPAGPDFRSGDAGIALVV